MNSERPGADGRGDGRGDAETTRRLALKLAGGAALLAFAGAGPGRAALAQEASPVASPAGGNGLNGKYVVIRIRTVKPDRSADELMALIQDGFVPLVEDVPGFIWYVAGANPETRGQPVGVFEDEAGAAESSRARRSGESWERRISSKGSRPCTKG